MTAALAFNPDVPQPKYRNGQTVFRASEVSSVQQLQCPDCLGTRKWRAVAPSGAEYEASCQRCSGRTDLPSLNHVVWHPSVDRLTIGSIRIDTAENFSGSRHRESVSYMCRETGIGSGTIYYESQLFETEDEARQAATVKAAAHNVEERSKPERIEQLRISYLTIKDATLDECRSAIWNSWYRYRNLRENMEEFLEGDSSVEDLRSNIEYELDFDKKYRNENHPLDALLIAASKIDHPELKAALKALPFAPLSSVEAD